MNDIPVIYVKLVLSGASGTGNNRIDNVKFVGTAVPSGKTVTFNSNYGTPTTTTQTSSIAANLTANSFTRTGYAFANWHTTTSGTGGTTYTDGQNYSFSSDLALYAQWNINQYAVSYDLNGGTGTVPTAQTANYDSNIILSSGTGFSRAGFTFSGWNTVANGSGTAYAAGANYVVPATNQTLYAQWISTAPVISTSGTITAMTTVYGTPSAPRSFTFTANNLTGSQLIATASVGFEVSISSDGTYGSTANYSVLDGSSSGTIYIRIAKTTSVGSHAGGSVTLADNTNSATASATIATSTVNPKELTISGLTATGKVYDGNTSASVTGTPAYVGLENNETFPVSNSATWAFSTKNVGATLTRSGNYNAPSTNYTITQPALTATITPKTLAISAPSITSKVYNGSTTTGAVSPGTLSGLVGTEALAVSGIGTFDVPNAADAGTNKPATIVYTLANGSNGGLATNYSLANGAGVGDITKATPVYTATTISLSVGGSQTIASSISNSPGALTFSSLNTGIATVGATNGLVSGVAVGSTTVNVTQAESTNYIAGSTAVPVSVNAITYLNGDFMTKSTGTWTNNTSGTVIWYKRVNGAWVEQSAGSFPSGTTSSYTVYITEDIEVPASGVTQLATSKIYVTNNKTLTYRWGSNQWTFNNIIIDNGATIKLDAAGRFTVSSSGQFEILNGGNFNYSNTSTNASAANMNSSLWNGTEVFHPNSNVIIGYHQSGGSNYFLPSATSLSTHTENGTTAYFGNLIFDASVQDIRLTATNLSSTTTYLTAGNLEIRPYSISSGSQNLFYGAGNWIIGKNLIIGSNSTSAVNSSTVVLKASTNSGNIGIKVKGDVINNSTNTLNLSNSTLGLMELNVDGDLEIGESAKLISTLNSNPSFNFSGTGNGSTDALTQTIDVKNAATSSNIVFSVNSGAYVKLINQDLALGTNSSFTVKTGGTLDFGFNGANALNITRVVAPAAAVGQSFTSETGSTLKISSPDGIVAGSTTPASDLYKGNVQVGSSNAARLFSPNVTYHYIGKANQITGSGLPQGITGKVIVDLETQSVTQDDLDFKSSNTTSFGTSGGNNGVLEIRKGRVFDEAGNGFRNFNGIADDGEDATQRGDITMTGGRYVISGSGTKPNLSGNYNLVAGTVEFAGTSASKIRVKPLYHNVDVSGTNVEPGGKNLNVNNLLKITDPFAVFTIPSTLESENPYVVNAKKGIQIVAGGKALFKNNANLLQDKDAANIGSITMERNANVPSTQYNYWSSPVKSQTLYSLYAGIPNNSVMVYNSANDRFTALTTASNPLSAFAKGYSIKGSATLGDAITANFVGEPNNETTSGVNTIVLSAAGNNYNLIGNPYPSNLNIQALYNDPDNTAKFYNDLDESPTVYFWDNTSNTYLSQLGSGYVNQNYAIFNLSSGVGTSAPRFGTSGKIPNGIVKPGQGFIIRALETAGNLTFKNSHRTSTSGVGGVYYKESSENNDRYWLRLTTSNNMNIVIALAYNPEASNSFERFDSTIFSEAVTENFYSLSSDSKKLAIQSREGNFNSEDVIPLAVKTSVNGTQKISINEKSGIFAESQSIYLRDKLLNKIINLSSGDYTFEASKGTDATRFEIVYKDTSVLGNNETTKSDFIVYRDKDSFVVKSSKILGRVEIYDVGGRLIRQLTSKEKSLTFDASELSNAIYIIKAENSGDVKTKKILK
ncbi:beta strand repeat-containing protein [Chryseobacterium sp. FH1]|uniref:beta strand repeat-containing protein n=1 Tax=Chryseobacterium sp. FH1 TaxID=1233951 RepID=UPI0004E3608D|nr:InlB B-repeat-containing protein [Chryseobacterium sp. FH1]KFC19993.1 hypothetical protein IO90_12310 [Chryseobacterium sp. FH1]